MALVDDICPDIEGTHGVDIDSVNDAKYNPLSDADIARCHPKYRIPMGNTFSFPPLPLSNGLHESQNSLTFEGTNVTRDCAKNFLHFNSGSYSDAAGLCYFNLNTANTNMGTIQKTTLDTVDFPELVLSDMELRPGAGNMAQGMLSKFDEDNVIENQMPPQIEDYYYWDTGKPARMIDTAAAHTPELTAFSKARPGIKPRGVPEFMYQVCAKWVEPIDGGGVSPVTTSCDPNGSLTTADQIKPTVAKNGYAASSELGEGPDSAPSSSAASDHFVLYEYRGVVEATIPGFANTHDYNGDGVNGLSNTKFWLKNKAIKTGALVGAACTEVAITDTMFSYARTLR